MAAQVPRTYFAITIADQAVGGIGYTLNADVERIAAAIGYWLGVTYWSRGIGTAAVRAVTTHAFQHHVDLRRIIYAAPYGWSAASVRVLVRAGYKLEGRMRESALKNGQVVDQFMYAILRDECSTSA